MNEPAGTPAEYPSPEAPKKKSNVWIIVVVVLVLLCCCCAITGFFGWQYGDQILQQLSY